MMRLTSLSDRSHRSSIVRQVLNKYPKINMSTSKIHSLGKPVINILAVIAYSPLEAAQLLSSYLPQVLIPMIAEYLPDELFEDRYSCCFHDYDIWLSLDTRIENQVQLQLLYDYWLLVIGEPCQLVTSSNTMTKPEQEPNTLIAHEWSRHFAEIKFKIITPSKS